MFPKLSDLINYLLGSHIDLPIQTYGFFLTFGFLTGGFVLRSELKRKEKEGLLKERIIAVHSNKLLFKAVNLIFRKLHHLLGI